MDRTRWSWSRAAAARAAARRGTTPRASRSRSPSGGRGRSAGARGWDPPHRDLKPDNVMISRRTATKIPDFGPRQSWPTRRSVSEQATLARPLTGAGGCRARWLYRPSRPRAKATDFRSDQFGARSDAVRDGDRRAAVPARDGRRDARRHHPRRPEPIARLNPRAPAPLRWITERCLARTPTTASPRRARPARDLASLRDHLSETTSSAEALPAPRASARWRVPAALARRGARRGIASGALAPSLRCRPGSDRVRPAQLSARHRAVGLASRRMVSRWSTPRPGRATRPGVLGPLRQPRVADRWACGRRTAPGGSPRAARWLSASTGANTLGWERLGTLSRAPLGGGTAPRLARGRAGRGLGARDGQALAGARDAGEKRRLEFPLGKVLYRDRRLARRRPARLAGRPAGRAVDHPERGDNLGTVSSTDHGRPERSSAT